MKAKRQPKFEKYGLTKRKNGGEAKNPGGGRRSPISLCPAAGARGLGGAYRENRQKEPVPLEVCLCPRVPGDQGLTRSPVSPWGPNRW